MSARPEYFKLEPTRSRHYLEAVLIDAGLDTSEAFDIAIRAHDCGGGDASPEWQRERLTAAVEAHERNAKREMAAANAIRNVIAQFYGTEPDDA